MSQLVEILEIFINNIAPILIIAGVGFIIRRNFPVDPKTISTLMFYVLSPCLVFSVLVVSDIGGGEFIALYFVTILFQVIMAALAYGAMQVLNANPLERANVILASFCLNAGNFGLSLIAFAFGDEVLARAAVVFAANITMNYSLGVFVASNGRRSPISAAASVLRTPAIYALIAAFVVRMLQIDLPLIVARPIDSLGDAAIPMMLLLLGLQLGQAGAFDRVPLVATGVGLRLLVSPFLATGLALLIGLEGAARIAFILEASMPTAVLTIVLSTEFELDRDLALNMIMATTLLSPVTLSVLIFLLQ